MARGKPIVLEGNDNLAALWSMLPFDRLFTERDACNVAVKLGGAPYHGISWWNGLRKHGLIVRSGVPIGRSGKRFYWQRTPGALVTTFCYLNLEAWGL